MKPLVRVYTGTTLLILPQESGLLRQVHSPEAGKQVNEEKWRKKGCLCLSREYSDSTSVIFKQLCTKSTGSACPHSLDTKWYFFDERPLDAEWDQSDTSGTPWSISAFLKMGQ